MATQTTVHADSLRPASPARLLAMFVLAMLGLSASAYLAIGYMGLTPLSCTDTGCDTVRLWHEASHLPKGAIPLSGILFFLAAAVFAVRVPFRKGDEGKQRSRLALAWGAVGLGVALVLTGLEAFVIHAFCFWCLLIAFSALGYFSLSLAEYRNWQSRPPAYDLDFEPFIKWGWIPVLLVVLLAASLNAQEANSGEKPIPDDRVIQPPPPGGPKTINNPGGIQPDEKKGLGGNPTPPPVKPPDLGNGGLVNIDLNQLIPPTGVHSKGPADAPVTLVEFADPSCHVCAAQAPLIDAFLKEHPKTVRLVYRHFPLRSHIYSRLSASAMEAAGEQNPAKFWELRDLLYSNLQAQTIGDLLNYGQKIGLNMDQFKFDVMNNRYMDRVVRDRADGDALGIHETPTMFVNGKVRFNGEAAVKLLDDAYNYAMSLQKPATPKAPAAAKGKTPAKKATGKPSAKPKKAVKTAANPKK